MVMIASRQDHHCVFIGCEENVGKKYGTEDANSKIQTREKFHGTYFL